MKTRAAMPMSVTANVDGLHRLLLFFGERIVLGFHAIVYHC
jgi:hypothetical protein